MNEPVEEEEGTPVPQEMEEEIALTELDLQPLSSEEHPGTPASLACPECGGTLRELRDGELSRFGYWEGHIGGRPARGG